MGYARFDTAQAEYRLQTDMPAPNHKDFFTGIDALVIGTGDLKKTLSNPKGHIKKPIELCKAESLPIYGADTPLDLLSPLISLLPHVLMAPISVWPSIIYGIGNLGMQTVYKAGDKRIDDKFVSYLAKIQELMRSPNDPRTAIIAEKIENYITPEISLSSGKEKPIIGLIYSTSYVGLLDDIQSEENRRKTIKKWSETVEKSKIPHSTLHMLFDMKRINIIEILQASRGSWSVEEIDSGIIRGKEIIVA